MNEILLAFLSFGAGILATLITQLFSRRLGFADARRKQRLKNLELVKLWMEAYRELFDCKFPQDEVLFAYKYLVSDFYLVYDKTAPKRVYRSLKEYRDADSRYRVAERKGQEALELLGERQYLDRFTWPFVLTFRRETLYYYTYPRGFPRVIAPYLDELSTQRYKLFTAFLDQFDIRIDWEELDHIEGSSEVGTIVNHPLPPFHKWREYPESEQRYSEKEITIADSRDARYHYRRNAEQAIDQILKTIRLK
jgi:hypothetical protein